MTHPNSAGSEKPERALNLESPHLQSVNTLLQWFSYCSMTPNNTAPTALSAFSTHRQTSPFVFAGLVSWQAFHSPDAAINRY